MPSRRRWLVAGAALLAVAIAIGSFALAFAQRYAPAPTRIEVQTTPIEIFDNREPSQTRFGNLEFRGGLVLSSKHEAFGGLSGLHVESDGSRFVAVTDRGSWLRGQIAYRNGRPAGIVDAELAPILGADGKPFAAAARFDAEAMTELDGQFYLAVERVHRIFRFDYRAHGVLARGEPVAMPSDFGTLLSNKGIECLAAGPKGSALAGQLIAVSEASLDAAGNMRAFLIKGDRVERFAVKRSGDFDVSGCDILPSNDLLLLERHYSPSRGIALRISRVPLDALKPGATVEGEPLILADLAYQIDNMEAIAVHRNAQGETIITLVSDDNFSPIQRNLLLQFKLVE